MISQHPQYVHTIPDLVWFYMEFGQSFTYHFDMWHRAWLRNKLSEAQNHKCCYCGLSLTLEGVPNDTKNFATFEHVIRKCEGGSDGEDNLVVACGGCNSGRQDTPAESYLPPGGRFFKETAGRTATIEV